MADQEVPGTDELFGLIGGDEPPIDEFIGGKSKKARKSRKQRGGGCGCSMN